MKTKIIYYILLLLIACAGVYIRTNGISDIMLDNVVAFYYARARDLQANNEYPLEDKVSYAPETLREDYPFTPAYFSLGVYNIIHPFMDIPFSKFIMISPVIIYLILLVAGFLIMNNLYGRNTGFFFAALLTIMPAATFLTKKGYYTEEPLGVLLVILFFFFFIKSEKSKTHAFLAIITLTLFELTWQIFHWLLAGIIACMIIRRKNVKTYLLILILPLLLGHIISVYLVGLDYSPVYMLKEAYIGYKYEHTEDFQIAFHRGKHKPVDFNKFVENYSYLGIIFLALGLFVSLKNLKKTEYYTLLVYVTLGFVAIAKYIKFKFLTLVFILIISSIGMDYAYNLDLFTKLKLWKRLRIKKYWKIGLAILLIAISIPVIGYLRNPRCEVNAVLPEDIEVGKTYEITLQAKNVGKDALCIQSSFSGLHIEVENAKITDKKAYSPTTKSGIAEKNYTTRDLEWFEAKFDCLKHNDIGEVTFSITPRAKPVKINHRCWIPRFCLMGAPENILPEFKMAWRNEKCIRREPSEGNLCSVPVYAGYEEKQDFYCSTLTLN